LTHFLKLRIGTDAHEGSGLISHPILFFCSEISRHTDSDIFPSRFLYTPRFWDFFGSMKLAGSELATARHCAPVHATGRHSAPLVAKKSARKNLTGFAAAGLDPLIRKLGVLNRRCQINADEERKIFSRQNAQEAQKPNR
jgi:hypothetical protein